jgi:hypothetical protein
MARGCARVQSGAGAVSEGGTASYKLLMDRIQAAEAAIAAGSGNGGSVARHAGVTSGSTMTGPTGSSLGGGITGGGADRGPTNPASGNRLASAFSRQAVSPAAQVLPPALHQPVRLRDKKSRKNR